MLGIAFFDGGMSQRGTAAALARLDLPCEAGAGRPKPPHFAP